MPRSHFDPAVRVVPSNVRTIHARKLSRLLFCLTAVVSLAGLDISALAAGRERAETAPRQTLMHNGIERRYVVHVPSDRAPRQGLLPLVLVLHGGGGNAANAASMTGFTAKAENEGFIVVYPEGTGRFKGKLLTWNAGHCCGQAMERRMQDVEFISALIDKLIKNYPVDPKRVYATGMSNGGMMAHRLGIELSHKIAAIAPVVATLFGDEQPPRQPVSALMLNGMLDKSVPYQGGPPGGRFAGAWDGTPAKPAVDQAAFWASVNGCKNTPDKSAHGAMIQSKYRCPAGRSVEIYLIKDHGHAWPGGQAGSRRGDKPSPSLNGTDVIWNFFKAHAK